MNSSKLTINIIHRFLFHSILEYNSIKNEGAIAFAKALEKNKVLKKINLGKC